MEETSLFINFETLDLARVYLFGGVKYLDLLLVLSIIDVLTGVIKAWKFKNCEVEAHGLAMSASYSISLRSF